MGPLGVAGDVIGRVRREIGRACGAGGRAAERFVAEVRRQLDDGEPPIEPRNTNIDVHTAAPESSVPPPREHDGDDGEPATIPAVEDLPLPDYDLLPAAHVVAALGDLEQHERDAIEAYERAGRHRRTILGKLDQLREDTEA